MRKSICFLHKKHVQKHTLTYSAFNVEIFSFSWQHTISNRKFLFRDHRHSKKGKPSWACRLLCPTLSIPGIKKETSKKHATHAIHAKQGTLVRSFKAAFFFFLSWIKNQSYKRTCNGHWNISIYKSRNSFQHSDLVMQGSHILEEKTKQNILLCSWQKTVCNEFIEILVAWMASPSHSLEPCQQ